VGIAAVAKQSNLGSTCSMQAKILIQQLRAENASCLKGADVFDHPVDPAQLAVFLADPGNEMVIAMVAHKVVGMASGVVLLHPDKAPAFLVAEIGVSKDMRRQGIGTALLRRLLQLARARGCRGIWLATEADNTAARALYGKLAARETPDVVVCDWDGAMDEGE
jgi:ribosomal protein S18 acetylase RimI-like enzyme